MANAPIEYASAGGQGGLLTKRGDMRLYRQAVEGGYNIPPEVRQEIVAVAREIMNSKPDVEDGVVMCRDQLAAAKVLLAADKMDLEVARIERAEQTASITFNGPVQFNGVAKSPESMTLDELDAYIAKCERELAAGEVAASSGAEGGGAPSA